MLRATTGQLVLAVAAMTFGAGATVGQQFVIGRSTVDGGGVMRSTGGAFEISGTIGQHDAGSLAGGAFELSGGFWFGLVGTDCNEDGTADLIDHGAFETCLEGPGGVIPEGCQCFDTDHSGTIDLRDFAAGQSSFQGP